MGARVIGFGQAAAGDDAVGLAVLQSLREMTTPEDTELLEAAEATALLSLLETSRRVVIVDGMVADGSVGRVLEFDAAALEAKSDGPRAVSTHGIDIGQVIALATIVSTVGVARSIWIVGVTIAPPRTHVQGLSQAVRAAVPLAARAVLAHLEHGHA